VEPAGRADVFVRPAHPADAAAVAAIQVATWRTAYAAILPPEALEGVDAAEAEARWQEAVTLPPTPAHALLVAVDRGTAVGFVAVGPGSDDDATGTDGEIFELLVAEAAQHQGHGSRLLAAGTDHLRDHGLDLVRVWLFEADEPAIRFYSTAGWAPDGSRRSLDMGQVVPQIRLHARLDDRTL
jgi:ribosomal protein S18 acetylase RimI-like enzyme